LQRKTTTRNDYETSVSTEVLFVQSEQTEMDNTEGDAENTDRSYDQPIERG
jgi:hypothetical protein